jgi:hypothetical protein
MENRKEIIKGYFVGDIVMLEKETKITKKDKIQIGTIGTVSEGDNKKSLEGWTVIDLKKRFKEAIDKLEPEKIKDLMEGLTKIYQNQI